MNEFWKILESLYKIKRKHPELRFGQIISSLTTKEEDIYYLCNYEILKRLEEVLKNE